MSYDVANFSEYTIRTENQISVLLSHFDSNLIYEIIKDIVTRRTESYNFNQLPNIPGGFETYFKQMKIDYPADLDDIEQKRTEAYSQIIETICQSHGLGYNGVGIDLYSPAFYLYDFLISGFNNHLISFFTNFIVSEKNNLYESLNLANFKKNKDSSTLYNKKVYEDPKLAVISANLEYVIGCICTFDIPWEVLIDNAIEDINLRSFMKTIVSPIYDFFKMQYAALFADTCNIKPILITNIRLELQKYQGNSLNISDINN